MSRMCYKCTLYSEVHADTFPCNVCFGSADKCNFTERPNDIEPGRVFANARALQDKVLEYGDFVQFGSVLYMVQNEWLDNRHGSNGRIWKDLGLYDKRAQIMQAFLGRDAKCPGDWPEYDLDRDAKGLTACVQWLLYRLEFPDARTDQTCKKCVFWNFGIRQAPCKACAGLNAFIPAYGFIRDTECDTEGDTEGDTEPEQITCIADLDRVSELRQDLPVVFKYQDKEYKSEVNWCGARGHLSFQAEVNNVLFTVLGVDANEFCSDVWGRETDGSGIFPYFKSQQEARAIVRALYEALERKDEVEAGPRTFVSPKELAGEVLRPGDVLYIQSVKYEVVGNVGWWYLRRVSPDSGRNGKLFRDFDLNAWELIYNIGLSQGAYYIDKAPSDCMGWPEADTLENLTKFVHIVYALTTVYQVGHCKGQAIGRDDYKAETERKIENAIKVLQQ